MQPITAATGQQLAEIMMALVDVPYIWGGKDPSIGLDCSGAVAYCMEQCGLVPSDFAHENNAENIQDYCIPINKADVRPGDLAFYGTQMRTVHVMMFVGPELVMGAQGGGPHCKTRQEAEALGACVKTKPEFYRADLVDFRRVPQPSESDV